MALVLLSGLRGGVGVTTVTANLAMILAGAGRPSVVLDLSPSSTMGMHFGLDCTQPLPGFDAPAAAVGPIHGVRLLDAAAQAGSGDLAEGLASGDFSFHGETLYLADLSGAPAHVLTQLRAHADLELSLIAPTAECIFALPAVVTQTPDNALFVLNRSDDLRRLSRHAASFLRELLGERLVATIHADEAVPEAAAMMQPLGRHAPASAALADLGSLAERIAMLCAASTAARSRPEGTDSSESHAA